MPSDSKSLDAILKYFYNLKYEIKSIIHKDSLDIDDSDRKLIVELIKRSKQKNILIVHGTDTMSKTAKFLNKCIIDKTIVLTGAMAPFSVDSVEATANLSASLGYLLGVTKKGVYISMHGLIESHNRVFKNREKGVFQKYEK